jgi:hypothetical protein
MAMKKATLMLALACAVAGSACGSGGGSAGGGAAAANPNMTLEEAAASTLVIEIRNNIIPDVTVNVFYKPAAGRQRLLGVLQANSTGTYTVPGREVAGGYSLVAEGGPREALQSRLISEGAGYKVSWNMATNIIRVERMDDE